MIMTMMMTMMMMIMTIFGPGTCLEDAEEELG
jgi:hypothetical protein